MWDVGCGEGMYICCAVCAGMDRTGISTGHNSDVVQELLVSSNLTLVDPGRYPSGTHTHGTYAQFLVILTCLTIEGWVYTANEGTNSWDRMAGARPCDIAAFSYMTT